MNLLGVDIPPLDGHVQLRFLLTKKRTLEMMECVEEFVNSEVLVVVQQRTDKIKIDRMAKVEEIMKALKPEEATKTAKRMAAVAAAAALRRKEEDAALQLKKEQEEHARQLKKEQEEQALQRKKEQEEQAPKARGKYKTFDDRMEDLKLFKETHDHVNVTIHLDNSLTKFCSQARHARKNPGKSKMEQLTNEHIAAFDAIGFIWTSQEYVTRSFDERIEDLEEYKRTHGHLNVNRNEDNCLYQFCADVRNSLKHVEEDGIRKLTEECIARLDDLGFKW
jgi:nitrate reductase alpha subunit